MGAKTMLVLAAALLTACAAEAKPVRSERAACDLVKAHVAAVRNFPVGVIAFCDFTVPDSSPPDYYVMALHSNRVCEGICSTNMGWYAIHKATGRVYEWDVGEDRLGPPLSPGG